jgi:ribosome-associated heat shock protein Hsp15
MDKVRIDKWLWAARFFKTRGVATDAIKGGKVSLNGSKPKPSKTVGIGDKLRITQLHRKIDVTILALQEKRGSADIAGTLYQLESEQLNQKAPPIGLALAGYRERGAGRPTKRDRRKIAALSQTFFEEG